MDLKTVVGRKVIADLKRVARANDCSPWCGYAVVNVLFENGKPVGPPPKPVVTGFASNDEQELHGAPVGVAHDKEGEIVFADHVGAAVWRVTKAGN
ncbi:L-sorbosone dehydrogenase [Paraburkholderia caribensis MBA4]|uniref:L-sorbosone dehydrogenase n=1 Tax=Paraburkholderia caribensis MBA4 TaxID=1323664 RepID=A0A0P0RJX0_9BURK|nr:L-sorbosone dehydrogenase [Paraburkholderia caribensis MBA4]